MHLEIKTKNQVSIPKLFFKQIFSEGSLAEEGATVTGTLVPRAGQAETVLETKTAADTIVLLAKLIKQMNALQMGTAGVAKHARVHWVQLATINIALLSRVYPDFKIHIILYF